MRVLLVAAVVCAGCPNAAEDRALDDLEVGQGSAGGVDISVAGGLAHIRSIAPGQIEMWSQSPVLSINAETSATAHPSWILTIANCMPDAELVANADSGAAIDVTALPGDLPTARRWSLELPPGDRIAMTIAPPDWQNAEPWRAVVMGDIQQGLPEVHEVFDAINRTPGARMVLSTGDLVQSAYESEYELLLEQLRVLEIPYYSTIGNHELMEDTDRWQRRFGRSNLHFTFKGVTFSLVDSANASIHPLVYQWLEEWLLAGAGGLHVFLTHFPPLDPVGVRSGSFRSRQEAAKLLSRLSGGGVDLTLYGHIHSYYAFTNAGIEAHISGGGGASFQEAWRIKRHFLTVDFDPSAERFEVAAVPVD